MTSYPSASEAELIIRSRHEVGRIARIAHSFGCYISDDGRVFSVWKRHSSTTYRCTQLAILKDGAGYHQVNVRLCDGYRLIRVHTLVAAAFNERPMDGSYLIRHLNDDKDDNSAVNLAWGTQVENQADTKRNGRSLSGRPSRIAPSVLEEVRRRMDRGDRPSVVARECGVSPQYACDIRERRKGKRVLQ